MHFAFIIVLVFQSLVDLLGGNFTGTPDEWRTKLSPETRHWADSVLSTLDASRLVDVHMHLVGTGNSSSGIWLNRYLTDGGYFQRFKFRIYLSAADVHDLRHGDEEYWTRLQQLVRYHPAAGGSHLMAFDAHYRKDGTVDSALTEFYVPNEYVWQKAHQDPHFIPVISIHPYRKDALQELAMWGERGVHLMKWLPSAMGIDPADTMLIPFYRMMKRYGIVLLTHAGEEKAVEAAEFQRFGNPLRLRLPLDLGVKVVVAHCASLGEDEDVESKDKRSVSSFLLFQRLMETPKYDSLLFGDLSAVTQYNRYGTALSVLLEHPGWHSRLVNGSDYPLPAINAIIRTSSLARDGFITRREARYLKEIYGINPLIFDLLVKRVIRHPVTGVRFPDSVFYLPQGLKQ